MSLDMLSSSGGVGLIGQISSGLGSYYDASARSAQSAGQYEAYASNALLEADALSSKYKIGAINMLMEAEAERAQYESEAYSYELEALQKKGQAALYDSQSAISLLAKASALRSADIVGASALDVVRQGAEQESKLREQGRLFRGEQRTAIAAGGTDVSSGNALDILRQTDEGIEADSASIRYRAQKNRYALLQQQKNLWLEAEVRQLESEGYAVAAENLRSGAEISSMGADLMRKMGDVAYKSGQEGSELYKQLSALALESGQAGAAAYREMGSVYSSAAKSIGTAGLIGSIANGSVGLIGASGSRPTSSTGTGSFNFSLDNGEGWGDIAYSANDNDWWSKNEYKLGKFMPTVKQYKGLGGV